MDTKLKYVYQVYLDRSFTKAARRLFISQPSLSAMVKKAEDELGSTIFDRSTSPLELTEEGKAYIEFIQQSLENEESLTRRLSDIRSLNKGRVRIGGSNYVISSIMPEILKDIFTRFPQIQIELMEENSFTLHSLLESGALDLVIDSFEADNNRFACYKLLDETILLAVPKSDPINRSLLDRQITKDRILNQSYADIALSQEQAESLLRKPFVFLKAGNNMHQHAVSIFRQYGIQAKANLHLDQLVTSLQYTEAGLACSFVTDTLFRYGNRGQEVCLYALNSADGSRNMSIAHKRNKYLSNASRMFIHIAQEHFACKCDPPAL